MIGGVADGLTRVCRSSVYSPISYRLGGNASAMCGHAGTGPIAAAADKPMAGCSATARAAGAPARLIMRRSCRS
eukprot:8574315-Pyramimonas_sp.AAC.1